MSIIPNLTNKKKHNLLKWAAEAGFEKIESFLHSIVGVDDIEKIDKSQYNTIKKSNQNNKKHLKKLDKKNMINNKDSIQSSTDKDNKSFKKLDIIDITLKNIDGNLTNFIKNYSDTTTTTTNLKKENKDLNDEIENLKSEEVIILRKNDDLKTQIGNLNDEVEHLNVIKSQQDSNKSLSSNIKDIFQSTLSILGQEKNELVQEIISKQINENHMTHSFNALLLVERLLESRELANDEVFQDQFEGDVLQLISINICKALNDKDLDFKVFKTLIDYINDKMNKWEIITPDERGEYFNEQKHIVNGSAETSIRSKIKKFHTLLIKIKSHNLESTIPKKALVDIK